MISNSYLLEVWKKGDKHILLFYKSENNEENKLESLFDRMQI